MKFKKIILSLAVVGLVGSAAAFAGGGGDDSSARKCLAQDGSGANFTYTYKNPGWDGKACNKPVHVYACKSNSCDTTSKGSDSDKVVRWNTSFKPGFQPKSSAVQFD